MREPLSDDEDALVLPDAWARRIMPRRGGAFVPPPAKLDAKKALRAVRKRAAKHAEAIASVTPGEAADAALLDSARARLAEGGPAEAVDTQVEAVLAAVIGHPYGIYDAPFGAPVADAWASGPDLAFAVEALVGRLGWRIDDARGARGRRLRLDRDDPDANLIRAADRGFALAQRLRGLLASADDAAYAAAGASADALRTSFLARCVVTFLFPTEAAWAGEVVAEASRALGKSPKKRCSALWLLPSVGTVDHLEAILDDMSLFELSRTLDIAGRIATLVDGLGAAAAPALAKLVDRGDAAGSSEAKPIAEALGVLPSDEAAATLVRHVHHRRFAAAASEAAARFPRRMLRALGPALAGAKGEKRRAPLERLLAAVVGSAPDAADAVAGELPEAVRARIDALRASRGPVAPAASEDELPPILVAPPWLTKAARRKGASKPLPLDAHAHPESMRWVDEDEQRRWTDTRDPDGTYWASVLGAFDRDEWRAFVETVDPGEFPGTVQAVVALAIGPREIVRPLLDRWLALEERTRHAVFWGEWLPAIVGRFELDALPLIRGLLTGSPSDLELFLPFDVADFAPRVADALARLKSGRKLARAWLRRHPEAAAVGLIPDAVGEKGKPRDAARAALRYLVGEGERETIRTTAERWGTAAVDALADVLDFYPLAAFPKRIPAPPDWLEAGALPAVLLAGRGHAALPETAVGYLLVMLAFSDVEDPYVGLDHVRAATDPASLARFTWALFEAWLGAGAPAKSVWALRAVGVFGDDEAARALAPLVRAWPGESAHARAVIGLEVLAAIGSDAALNELHRIAQRVKFKGLRDAARERIDEVAAKLGLTADELADRLVPDLGLDERGTLELDYGPRRFTVSFDEHLVPHVKDETGKRLKNLPKPGKRDDAERAPAAEKAWKALKKEARAVSAHQVARFEAAMVAQRRWSARDFSAFIATHPLLHHLARRLVWGRYDAEGGALGELFRIDEDRSLADAGDEPFVLPEDATVGIAHRLDLTDDQARVWGERLSDYELLPPFDQLARAVHRVTPEEKAAEKLARFRERKAPTGRVLSLTNRGWRRGEAQDAGIVGWMDRPLPGGLRAQLDLEPGIVTGDVAHFPEQTLGAVAVTRGGRPVPLGELAPVVFSELVRDLASLEG